MQAKCDVCNLVFELNAIEEEPIPGGGLLQLFRCPKGHAFPIGRMTNRGRRLRDQLSRLEAEKPPNRRQIARVRAAFKREYTGLAR